MISKSALFIGISTVAVIAAVGAGVGLSGATSSSSAATGSGDPSQAAMPAALVNSGGLTSPSSVTAAGGSAFLINNSTSGSQELTKTTSTGVTSPLTSLTGTNIATASGADVWVASTATSDSVSLDEVNGTTGSIVSNTPVTGIGPKPTDLSAADGNLYLLGASPSGQVNSVVVAINATKPSSQTTIAVPGEATTLLSAGDSTYATTSVPGTTATTKLTTINDASNTITGTVQVPNGFVPMGFASNEVWGIETGTGQVLAVDPTSGTTSQRLVLSANGYAVTASTLVTVGTTVWIAGTGGATPGAPLTGGSFLYRVDASTGTVGGRTTIDGTPQSGVRSSASDGASLWINEGTYLGVTSIAGL